MRLPPSLLLSQPAAPYLKTVEQMLWCPDSQVHDDPFRSMMESHCSTRAYTCTQEVLCRQWVTFCKTTKLEEIAAMQLGSSSSASLNCPFDGCIVTFTLHAGGRSAKRRRAAEQETPHDAKRKRCVTIEMSSPDRDEMSHPSQSESATSSHSSSAEDSLPASRDGYAFIPDI